MVLRLQEGFKLTYLEKLAKSTINCLYEFTSPSGVVMLDLLHDVSMENIVRFAFPPVSGEFNCPNFWLLLLD